MQQSGHHLHHFSSSIIMKDKKIISANHVHFFKYIFISIYLISLFLFTNWFDLPKYTPIDLDELAWVNDAQVFDWRKNGNWENFIWSNNNVGSWTSHDFRLFDQPHLVKYIFGGTFSQKKTEPWTNEYYHQKNYLQFVKQSMTEDKYLYESESRELFGEKTIQAISLARNISSFFGILSVILISFFLAKEFSVFQSIIVIFLILTNSVFRYNLNLATADSISLFFILISIICFYYIYRNKKNRRFLFVISFITTAFAASSKVNGWILPVLFFLVSLAEEKRNYKQVIKWSIVWLCLYLGTYIYLQPELWLKPIAGLSKFFLQRISQQSRFEINGLDLNFFEYHFWLFQLFIRSDKPIFYLLKVVVFYFVFSTVLLSTIIKYIRCKTQITQELLVKNVKSILQKKSCQYSFIICVVWLSVFSYARIGFERYAMLPLLIIFIGFANVLEKNVFIYSCDEKV